MKNLKLYSEVSLYMELQSYSDETVEAIRFSAFDMERNRLFFLSSHNFIYTNHLASFHEERVGTNTSMSAEVNSIDLDQGDIVTAFDFLMEREAIIMGTSNGFLLLYSVDSNTTEVVGKVEGGVKCISPSPDGELLGVITGFGQTLVMTQDWDLLYETSLEDLPEGFDPNDPSFGPEYVLETPISWRGDGKYFATLSNVPNTAPLLKKLKVWERDSGILHSSSEPKPFMGAVLDWMPSGAKIAAVYDGKVKNECPSIVFFERNALERSAFNTSEWTCATIERLRFLTNCSSDLLAGIVRCENHDFVKIWFLSNNHWYLKNEIRYRRQDEVKFMWNPARPLQLICWTNGGQISVNNFIWQTAVMEDSTALVIDGSRLRVTPLSRSLIPPPMHLFSLKFSASVRDVSMYSKNSKNLLAAVQSDGCLSIVELPALSTWEDLEDREFNVETSSSDITFGSLKHLAWIDSHTLLAFSQYGSRHACQNNLLAADGPSGFSLLEIGVFCSENQDPDLLTCSGWNANILTQNSLDRLVIGISNNPVSNCSYVQFAGGKTIEYIPKIGINIGVPKEADMSFSSSCPWMRVVSFCSFGNSKPFFIGLDEIGRLYLNEKIICNNCSSFSVYSNFNDGLMTHLAFSTKQDLLFVVDTDDIINGELDVKYDNFVSNENRKKEETKKYVNIWERGAKIIGVLHGDEAAIILQTARGNLESVYPRKLVLASILNALVHRRFRDALLMVRRQRIDFNVITDHCGWHSFLKSASDFVQQVNNLSYITEFVCAIKNENIIQTLYKNYLSPHWLENADRVQTRGLEGSPYGSKVSSILMAVRQALEEHLPESPARELCMLTTLARSDPPLLEDALRRVKVIRELELSGSNNPRRTSFPSSEESLKHLLWLCDSEAVYEAALGLYDLNLAAIVALNAQRDPKEFIPFLQELEQMPSVLMQYKIDLKLNRLDKALEHIIAAGGAYFDDCMNLMKENPQLFPLGLKLIIDPTRRIPILEAWGDYLSDGKCFENAAMAYLSCSSLEKALKCYRACGNWSGVLTVAGFLKLQKDEIIRLAHELCEELQALGKPGEAAKIALEYIGDVNLAVNLFINAREWEEALRVAFMHTKEELISEVKNASLECASVIIGEYEEALEKVGKYLARYLAVRQRRLLLLAKLQSEEKSINDLDDDAASEASSNFSGMSAYTIRSRKSSAASVSSNATSKARDARRQRKRGKIRPGSPGEEMGLADHLKGMALTAGSQRELKSLLVSLVMFGEDETARKLQRTAENFQLSHVAAVKLVEDTLSSDIINEYAHTLEEYIHKVRNEVQNSEVFSWRVKVFISP